MPKTSTRSKSTKAQFGGGGVRRRDADFPSAPIHVTGAAQVKIIGISTARPSESSRAERNGLPVRPSTSGGPAPNNSKRKGAEKRETKDDLHFNSLRAHGSGTTVYDFPLPGSLLTPSNPPKSHPPIRTSSLPCADTHDQMGPTAAKLGVPPMKIGMTLGSPTHQPANWQSQAQIMYSARNATPDSVDTYVDYDVHVAGPLKQKSSKWKLFGGLFGATKKNQGGSPQTFYQLQPEEVVVKNTTDADYMDFGEPVSLGNQRPSKSKGWGRTNSQRNVKKQKPDLRRAQTAPLNFDVQDSTRGRIVTRAPEITLDRGPLLDVNIPSVEMERYSVMFGGLLQNTPGTTSSLLTRRQATLDRLKTVNEALALKEQELEAKARQFRARRATSPQPTKSPAFSLFPNTPRLTVRDGSPSPYRRSPLHRSNTSPAALSPNRSTFAPGPENETHAALMAPGPHLPVAIESIPKPSPQQTEQTRTPKQASEAPYKPQSSTRYWTTEESHLILDLPSSDTDGEDEEEEADKIYKPVLLPIKSKFSEPSWQMIAPQHVPAPSASGSTSSSSDHSTSTSASSISTTSIAPFTQAKLKPVKIQPPPPKLRSRSATTTAAVAHPRSKDIETSAARASSSKPKMSLDVERKQHTDANDHEARLETAADVSIARQISVSRQQRQLLIPIKASSSPSSSSSPSITPRHNQNFPLPLNVNRVASPLGAVASVARAEAPIDGHGRPVAERKASKRSEGGASQNKRPNLVAASVKPSTPTLVVVGGEERGQVWGGRVIDGPGRAVSGASREIRIGLTVEDGVGLGEAPRHAHPYRKSERVVVERISVASN